MDVLEYDVVCIGGGGAGVTAASAAAGSRAKTLLISKEPIGYGNTRIAGGGVATCGVLPEDSPEVFFNDLMAAGEHLNNPKLARVIADEARKGVLLAEKQGGLFRRDEEGDISRKVTKRAGGHSLHRSLMVCGAGPGLGQSLRAAATQSNVDLLEEAITVGLLRDGCRIAGLVAWRLSTGEPLVVRAPAVVLASGGLGWLYYPHTDCMRSSTGDGYALAYEAGAELVDMEQVQFIPFGCTRPASMAGLLLGEPLTAGPHGRLIDGRGRVVLDGGMNRLTRAQISRVIAEEVAQGNGTPDGGLLLDLQPNLSHPMGRVAMETMRDDGILGLARRAYGQRAARWEDPWEVSPTAHFTAGGVRIDESGFTGVPGLYAAGEVAGGVHGANRLGSVALTELFVVGRRAGEAAAAYALDVGAVRFPESAAREAIDSVQTLVGHAGEHRPVSLVRQLQRLMWAGAGPARTASQSSHALDELAAIRQASRSLRVSSIGPVNGELVDALELRQMMVVAEAVVRSASCREESRGAHVRLDYPERDDAHWLANLVARRENGGMTIEAEPIARG